MTTEHNAKFPVPDSQDKNISNSSNSNHTNARKKNRITSKQVVAMTGVVLLVLMYIVTLVLAIFDNSASGGLFMLSLCCTLVIPIIVFVYSWMWARLTGKKTVGDPEDAEL